MLTSPEILPHVENESDRLAVVVVGYADNLNVNRDADDISSNNALAAKNRAAGNEPGREESTAELRAFGSVMRDLGVIVYEPLPLPKESGNYNQVYPRDIAFVMADTLFVANMDRPNRKNEWQGIAHILDLMPPERIERAPQDVIVEGGDIVVDKGMVFVGVGQRTNQAGLAYIQTKGAALGLKVVPVPLRSLEEGQDVLHLDCAFVPVGPDSALIFPAGFAEIPEEIRRNYKLIPVTPEEQQQLATNVLALSPSTVIARDSTRRVNDAIAAHGIRVVEVKFDEAPRSGGSLRCCTLPLVRQSQTLELPQPRSTAETIGPVPEFMVDLR